MNKLVSKGSGTEGATSEVEGLQRALDASYSEFRERALAEWQRRYPSGDPSDACVRVHIAHASAPRQLGF